MGTGVTRQQDRAPEASLPAGASVTGETAPAKGPGEEFSRLGDLLLAPGLALMGGVTIDRQPSAGGFGRLPGVVAQNPRVLGIGSDGDTAIVVGGNHSTPAIGGVYEAAGGGITHSSVAEGRTDNPLSLSDVRLHGLSAGNAFDLEGRRPFPAGAVREAVPGD